MGPRALNTSPPDAVIIWGLNDWSAFLAGVLRQLEVALPYVVGSQAEGADFQGAPIVDEEEFRRRYDPAAALPVVVASRSADGRQSDFSRNFVAILNEWGIDCPLRHPAFIKRYVTPRFPGGLGVFGFPSSGNTVINSILGSLLAARDPDATGLFYVDGHVRIYHGSQTALPRRYVSRQRLCLRGTTDYWVNALDGQPFFVVTKPVDPGMVKVLQADIVPRLEKDAPNLVSDEELAENPLRHRFTLVFDREGYSPVLFAEMWKRRIACLTYRKSPGEPWPAEEFREESVTLANGEHVQMLLAERGVFLKQGAIWVREIRRLTDSGHQTPIVTTDYTSERTRLAPAMFGRWSQENFFKYMLEHYGLDRLSSYSTESIPETTRVVNPAHRALDSAIRKKNSRLTCQRAKFAALALDKPIEPKVVKTWETRKAEILEEIGRLEAELDELKPKRKATPRHIPVSALPADQRFDQLHASSKHFVDTIKMVAYRAETAMTHVLREKLSRFDDGRALVRALYANEADLVPDHQVGTLTVTLHHLANHSTDAAIHHLCRELTATETVFPETGLRLVYELGSDENPGDQEV